MDQDCEGSSGPSAPHGNIPIHLRGATFSLNLPPVKRHDKSSYASSMGGLPRNEPPTELVSERRYPRNSIYQWLQPDYPKEDESSDSGLESLLENRDSGTASSLDDEELPQVSSTTPLEFERLSEVQRGTNLSCNEEDLPTACASRPIPSVTTARSASILTRSQVVHQLRNGAHFKNEFFQVRRSGLAGLGAYASQDLKCGDVILKEEPLLTSHLLNIFEDFERLDHDSKAVALSMSRNHELPSNTPQVLAVWETNCFATRQRVNDSGLFAIAGRFNHACRPANNMEFLYDKELGCIVLTVIVDVPKDRELTICYGGDRTPYDLWYHYGFRCQCGACPGFSEDELQELDHRQWNC